MLRLWLRGHGYRRIAKQVQADRKTVRRCVEAARGAGLEREGSEEALSDELLGAMVLRRRNTHLTEDEEFEIATGCWSTTDDEEVDQHAVAGVEDGKEHRAASVDPPVLPVKPFMVACRLVSGRLGDVGSGDAGARRGGSGFGRAADLPEPVDG